MSTDPDGDGRVSVAIDPIVTFARSNSTSTITELRGRIDPAFGNGTAVGIVSRKVNLDYVPR